MYNLKISAFSNDGDPWGTYSLLEKSVMSGSGEYDAAFYKQSGFEQASANGYVLQLDDLLDFEKPWWDSKSLEGFSVLGKTYAISGDVTFMDKLSYIAIFFNKPMAEDYGLGDTRISWSSIRSGRSTRCSRCASSCPPTSMMTGR